MHNQDPWKHHQVRLDLCLRLCATGRAGVLVLGIEALRLEEVFHALHQTYLLRLDRLWAFVDKVLAHFLRFDATLSGVRYFDVLQHYSIDTYQ